MLKIRIIPCLDVKDGRVVKGINFVDLVDAGDPVEQAKVYDAQGADELCFLDITASSDNRNILLDVVRKTANQCFMPLTVGGGVRNLSDIRNLLLAGADKVGINTSAITSPDLIKDGANKFGSQCIVVAIDAKKVNDKWMVYTHGGRQETGLNAIEWAQYVVSKGAGELLVTSMDRDGTGNGFDIELTSPSIQESPSVYPYSELLLANNCIPTHIPKKGFLSSKTLRFIASNKPGLFFRPFIQSANAPTPGRTIFSNSFSSSQLFITLIFTFEETKLAAFSKDLKTERILPDP